MNKSALSIDDQLALLKSRGITVHNESKAKEILGDIGYYRLGFYLFPFERTYPELNHRTHEYKEGTNFEDAVRLYYFDFELRNILIKYISRIEVNFKTSLTYEGSIAYKPDSLWFVNPLYIQPAFIVAFDKIVYTNSFKKNPTIKRHHRKYPEDRYAPAWKTIELMTLGETVKLYSSLIDHNLKQTICEKFAIKYVEVFENYIEIVRILRNNCAHANVLFDFRPFKRIKRGPADLKNQEEYMNLYGSIKVVGYLLKQVSINREFEMMREIQLILDKYNSYPEIAHILEKCSGLPRNIINLNKPFSTTSPNLLTRIKKLRKLFTKKFGFYSKKN